MNTPNYVPGAIDAGGCISSAWELVKPRYFMYFGVTLLILLPLACLPFVNFVLFGPLVAGIYFIALQDMKGEPVEFGMMFKGFERFLPLMGVGILESLPGLIMTILNWTVQLSGMLIGIHRGEEDISFYQTAETYSAAETFIAPVLILLFVVNIVWTVSFTFAIPLVIDHGLGVIEASLLSFRASWSNIGGIILLYIFLTLLALVGLLALCIGVLFVLPIVYVALAFAYRQVFPDLSEKRSFDMPPPPEAYQSTFGEAI
ncbi:MAG: hypothetical protein C4324_01500 [Blastocatellia bacterium]